MLVADRATEWILEMQRHNGMNLIKKIVFYVWDLPITVDHDSFSRHRNSLRAGRSGDRILMCASFSVPVQTASGAHTVSYTIGTGSLYRV